MKIPTSVQEANALLALRKDTLRELQSEVKEIESEVLILEKYIEKENNKTQLKMF